MSRDVCRTRGSVELLPQISSFELALGFDGYTPLSSWLRKPSLVLGARVGVVLHSGLESSDGSDPDGFRGLPDAAESSFFGKFVLGLRFDMPWANAR